MRSAIPICLTLAALGAFQGCAAPAAASRRTAFITNPVPPPETPRELCKMALPTYTIEPPDILVIEAIHVVPRSPYTLRTSDIVGISVQGTLPDNPIVGTYPIQPGGLVNLGTPYGAVNLNKLTVEQAQAAIETTLKKLLKAPIVTVTLVEMSGKQQVAGQHLVCPDGSVTLGSYGSVPVVGMTLAQAKQAIEAHLANFLEDPEVGVDVFAYNSKVYYVVTEGAGLGDGVTKFPITGNETVLDAISNVNGLTEVSSKRIWVARPAPLANGCDVLAVDWRAITAQGDSTTNYQLLPGDRVFVAEDSLVAFDTRLAKLFDPINRITGFTLLSTNLVSRLSGKVLTGGGLRGANSGLGGVQ